MIRILISVLILNITFVYGQNQSYPTGVYNTFEDFRNKKPSSIENFTVKENKNIINNTFQIKNEQGKKFKEAFALSDGEKLYIHSFSMRDRFSNIEFDRPNTIKKDYSLAELINDKYIYFENYFQSKGVSNWGIGKVYLSGIIYDIEEGTFTALNSFDDLNSFLKRENLKPIKKTDLQNDKLEITDTRKIMVQIFELE